MSNTYRIAHATVTDYARLTRFDADIPDGLFIIGGKNGNGKTSAVDAVILGLNGGKLPACPVRKKQRVASCKMPVDGLAFEVTDEGKLTLTYKGLPFDRASSAQQLCVSVPLVFAKDRKLKFAYIKDGALLDDESLALVARLTAECGGQLIMERVGHGRECDVILVDGESVKPSEVAA